MVGTAHWGEDGLYWRWSEGGVEATAFALRALLAINPKHELIEPTANWLIKNRRGAQWSNTRDTAIVVLALNDYLKSSGELTSNISYAVQLNGTTVAQKKVTQADILSAPSVISIDPKLIKDGDNIIRIVRKDGTGPLYYSAQAKYFSLEEPIPAEGHELFVRREYYKITPKETLLNGYREEKTLIEDGAELISGDRVEVVVVVESKNNYEYLVFEDLKPAGLEAVQLKSGELMYARQLREDAVQKRYGSSLDSDSTIAKSERFASDAKPEAAVSKRPFVPETPQSSTELTGQSRWVYQELRDRKVAMFIDKLPQGVWEMCYELRAEVPGKFHALPLLGHAMYVPEIKANSKELRIVVADRESSSLDE
jgi:hypothetical protein